MFSIFGQTLKLNSAQDVQEITTQLQGMEDLEEIRLSGNTLGVEAAQSIAAAIRNKKLKKIGFADMFTGRLKTEIPLALDAFVGVLIPMNHIVELDLSDNAFGPAGAEPLMKLLIQNRSIQILKLNNNGLGIEGVRLISSALVEAGKLNLSENRVSSLKILQMGRNRMESAGANHLIKAFQAHSESLEEIRLFQNSIRPDVFPDLMPILAGCEKLRILDLQDNTLTETGSIALSKALSSWEFLKILNIGECLLRSTGAIAILKSLTLSHIHLEKLYLSFNEIDTEAASLIPLMLENKTRIELLELNGNEFDPLGSIVTDIKQILRRHGHEDALDELDEMEWDEDSEGGDSEDEEEDDDSGDKSGGKSQDQDEEEDKEELELNNQLKNSATAKMEITASMMLNSAANDFAQSSRMSSFPSSESISSIVSWHGRSESVSQTIENNSIMETVDLSIKSSTIQGETILQEFTVDLLPEKYGFLKKHHKYLIRGSDSQVKRRYSDFLWIHEYLLRKYPYRLILEIPPKKLALDRAKLDSRRRGLARFVNYIFSHPVLSKDNVVNGFLKEHIEFKDFAQRIQFVEAEIPNQEIFEVPNDVGIYFAQLISSINVLVSKYVDLLHVLGLFQDSVLGQGGNVQLLGKFLKHVAIPLDCLDVSCKSCLRRCDGLTNIAHGLESLSQLQSEKNFKLLGIIIDFIQLQIDIFQSIKELFIRREKTIEDINLPIIIQKIEKDTLWLAEINSKQGFDAEIPKLTLLLDQELREKEWLEKRIIFMNSCIWSEIKWNHFRKSIIDDHIMHFLESTRNNSLDMLKILNSINYLIPPEDKNNVENTTAS